VRGRLVVNSIPLAIETAARGLGIARLPGALVAEGPAPDKLVEVLAAYAPPSRSLYAVHASGGRVSPAARAFLEIAKRHLERFGGQEGAVRVDGDAADSHIVSTTRNSALPLSMRA
jgi:DNA-binding transcriptional LysR family regulator